MSKVMDLHEKFLEYFHELEGYALRSERFYAEYKDPVVAVKWMEASFMAGAEAMRKINENRN